MTNIEQAAVILDCFTRSMILPEMYSSKSVELLIHKIEELKKHTTKVEYNLISAYEAYLRSQLATPTGVARLRSQL